jgi:hypothetical protein
MGSRRDRRRVERALVRMDERRPDPGLGRLADQLAPVLMRICDELGAKASAFDAEAAGVETVGLIAGLEREELAVIGPRLVALIADRLDTPARAMLTFFAESPDETFAWEASRADAALARAGVPAPSWQEARSRPVTALRFTRLSSDDEPDYAWLLAVFERAGERHGFLLCLDYAECGEITLIEPIGPAHFEEVRGLVEDEMLPQSLATRVEAMDAEAAARFIEGAVATTIDHLESDREPPVPGEDDQSTPRYLLPGRMMLLRRHLRLAGLLGDPPGHGEHVPEPSPTLGDLTMLEELEELFGDEPLPPRPRRDGAVPMYQLRVDIAGAKPPVWRRLQVVADVSLAEVHRTVQAAFDWSDARPHWFETPFGRFAVPGRGVEYANDEADVLLSQLLAEPKEKITYLYGAEEDWRHVIALEAVSGQEPAREYPRCIGGRQAAPREDCGGIATWQRARKALASEASDGGGAFPAAAVADPRSYFFPPDFRASEIDARLR